jgi:hypothetical protein
MTKTSNKDDGKDKSRTSSRERISLESFVHRKGQVRALTEFKYRKQHKKVETAKALRSYRKVMKQQGYEAGTGASRKRVEDSEEPTAENTEDTAKEEEEEPKEYKKRHKMNPFVKPAKRAEESKRLAATHKEEKETGEKDRQRCLKERKKRTKLLSKRTRRGQPIMKHVVDNLLVKLEKQNQR